MSDQVDTRSRTHPERVHFVIPAFNEVENIPFLLSNIRKFMRFFGEDYRVIVVDDGSTDGTAEAVREAVEGRRRVQAEVVTHETNKGPGAAFRTGFHRVLEDAEDIDFVVTIEADNTSDLCVLNRMLDRARRGNELVLASVYGSGRVVGAPFSRRVLSWCANMLIKIVFGFWGLTTFSSFFRLYRVDLLRRGFAAYGDGLIQEQGFVCMVEVLVKLHRMGCEITEVPMLLDSNIRRGDSKMKIVKTTLSYLRVMRRLALGRGPRPEQAPAVEMADRSPAT